MINNNLFTNFLTVFISILLFILWLIPPYMMSRSNEWGNWGALYIPVVILSICWGRILHKKYFES